MTNKDVGKRIIEAREHCGLNRKELASKIGVSPSTVTRYEKGEFGRVKLAIIEAIANATDTNPVWIMGKSDTVHIIHDSLRNTYRSLSPDESELLEKYGMLNSVGRAKAREYLSDLSDNEKYTKNIGLLDGSGIA